MREMTAAERREYLLGRARTASLATVRVGGGPHVAPVWFDLEGETLVFTTGEGTVKGRNMARDPRVSLCIDDENPPFHFILIEGTAELTSGDPATSSTGRRAWGDATRTHSWPTSTAGATP